MIKVSRLGAILGGAEHRAANLGKRWVSAILPYRPMEGSRDVLEAEYANGAWDYLKGTNELPRFSVVAGYCHYFKPGGAILEIGCGEGILQERLCLSKYSRYLGVDISEEAIRRCANKCGEKAFFVRADACTFSPAESFDIIVFNECLEYFKDPLWITRRYQRFLKKNGMYIISMFIGIDTLRTKHIWRMLAAAYRSEAETRVTTRAEYSWIVKVLIPAVTEVRKLKWVRS